MLYDECLIYFGYWDYCGGSDCNCGFDWGYGRDCGYDDYLDKWFRNYSCFFRDCCDWGRWDRGWYGLDCYVVDEYKYSVYVDR